MSNNSPKNPPSSHPDAKHERNAQVVELYLAGISQSKIAAMHGISRERVKQILVKRLDDKTLAAGLELKRSLRRAHLEAEAEKKRTTLRPVKRIMTIAQILHIYETYKSMRAQTPPATLKEIAKKVGMTEPSLWNTICEKRHNASFEFVRQIDSFNEAELQEILKMRESGATLAQIGKRFQLMTWSVNDVLKRARALETNAKRK